MFKAPIQARRLTIGWKRLTSSFSELEAMVSNSPRTVRESPLKDLCGTPTDRPFRVSIEGNIGAGKSTLIEYFDGAPDVEAHGEPIGWWRDLHGHNLLELMYADAGEWLKVFQSYVQLTRLRIQTGGARRAGTAVQIFERSVQNNRFCFVEVAHRNGSLSGPDFAVLDYWYEWIAQNVDIELDLIVYLRSTPEVVFERMRARGRPEEESVPLAYLQQLHKAHEDWLMTEDGTFHNTPVIVLDADQTLDDIHEQYKLNESRILGFDKRKKARVSECDKESVRRNLDLDLNL